MKKITIKNRHGLKMVLRVTKGRDKGRLVFLQHGLGSCKECAHMLALEELFLKNGYTVVNIDATNSRNESEASAQGATVTGHYEDLEDAINWAKEQGFYTEPFALAGQSLGALSVVRYAGEHPDEVDFIIPCSFPYMYGHEQIVEDDKCAKVIENGYLDKTSKTTGKTMRLTMAYVNDLKDFDMSKYIPNIKCNTYLIIGSADTDKHIKNTNRLYEMLKCGKEIFVLDGVPHDLANNDHDKNLFEEALNKIFTLQNDIMMP